MSRADDDVHQLATYMKYFLYYSPKASKWDTANISFFFEQKANISLKNKFTKSPRLNSS